MRDYPRWCALLEGRRLPAAIVDLDALDRNLATLKSALRAGSKQVSGTAQALTLRPASKSIRHVGLMRHIMERGGDVFAGLMTFSAHECTHLASEGFDDFLMGYPVGRRDEADALAALTARGVTLRATVDCPSQVAMLSEAALAANTVLRLCIDVDCSWRPLQGRLHLGVRRSPIRTADAAVALARVIDDMPAVTLDSVLTYEAQVAGIQDHNRVAAALDPLKRFIKSRSRPLVRALRREVIEALRTDGHDIEVVNGGGTGSVEWTAADPYVTEVTAGSGFLCPHTFDGFQGLSIEPAVFFALAVVRRSDVDHVTCAGGGYVASGAPGPDRLPIVHLPTNLTPLTALEGFGEVQTPLRVAEGTIAPQLGDPVLCRHAKGGELAERFAEYLLVRDDRIVDTLPTYRGQGLSFM